MFQIWEETIISIVLLIVLFLAVHGTKAFITAIIDRRKQKSDPLKGKRTIISEAVKMIAADQDLIKAVSVSLFYRNGTVIELRDPPKEPAPPIGEVPKAVEEA
jgi:hypothetical protein